MTKTRLLSCISYLNRQLSNKRKWPSTAHCAGTHALTLALFGVLRPGDTVLSVTGEPYDTLNDVIRKQNIGSLADFGIKFEWIPLVNGLVDFDAVKKYISKHKAKMIYIQRSRGYAWRLIIWYCKICRIAHKSVPK